MFVIYNGFKLYANLQTETDHALVLLADTIDKRDEYTYAHSQRVAGYAGEIARAMALPREEVELIVSAARVHDLGKIATADRILYKKEALTDEERQAIVAHPADGSELAGQFTMYRKGATTYATTTSSGTARGTPTAWPARTSRSARIITVADAYDAMTQTARTARRCRPRPPWPNCATAPAGSSTPPWSTSSWAAAGARRRPS